MKTFVALVVGRPGIVRDGLQAVVAAIPGIEALEPASDGPSVITRLNIHCQAIVILDSSLPENELLGTWSGVRKQFPRAKCLAIAASPHQQQTFKAAGLEKVFVEGASPSLLSQEIKNLTTQSSAKSIPESKQQIKESVK